MAKHRMTVEEHYSVGRVHPRGKVVDDGAENSIRREPAFETGNRPGAAFNKDTVQDPEDKPDFSRTSRFNDCSGWVRGSRSGEPSMSGENGEGKPGYDRGSSWRLGREKSLNWNSGSDHRDAFVKPERIVVNAKQRRND
jgi:hypothetical protein